MKILDDILAKFGNQTVIIVCVCLLIAIVAIIVYRMVKLKMYRKEIVELENQMNAIKSLPIQYRLGRVKGIGKNMPEIMEKYELYNKEFDELNNFQNNNLVPLINEIDEQLYYRKLSGARNKLDTLKEDILSYEQKCQKLLEKIEVITEVENEQRLEIIEIKKKYRMASDSFANVRFKIEDFVPSIPEIFEKLDERFVTLEDMMNNQRFDEAKTFSGQIEKDIDILIANLRDLPTYISIVRNYIPKRLEEIYLIIEEMKNSNFSIEELSAGTRYNQVSDQLEETIKNIKELKLETVGATIETMTEVLNNLSNDLEKEQSAYRQYEDVRNKCYRHIGRLDDGLKKMIGSLTELQENYLLTDYDISVEEDYNNFKPILDDLTKLTEVIESNNFSYSAMMDEFNNLIDRCLPFEDALMKYNELENSLRLEEKRALDELDNINIVLLEIKSEIKNKHLPMISESYKDYIDDSYKKADEIMKFIRHRPIDLKRLSQQVDAARDVIYKLYDNVHNLIVTAEMVEEAIIYGNRYRSTFLEVNTELTKAELLFRNGEYTKALSTTVDIIEKIKPGSYEMLINKNTKS